MNVAEPAAGAGGHPPLSAAAEQLRKVELFAALDEEDFARLCTSCSELKLLSGELLFSEGDHGDAAYVLASGEVEVFKTIGGREVLLTAGGGSRLIGEMALLLDEPRNASVRARTDASFITVSRTQFSQVLDSNAAAARAMLDVMTDRLRSTQSKLRQDDRMVQLGTLTAGLAHELNNPAAAVERGAAQLTSAVAASRMARSSATKAGLDLSDDDVADLIERAVANKPASDLTAVVRMEKEAEAEQWFGERGVVEPWTLAPTLVSSGIELGEIDSVAAKFDADAAVVAELVVTEHDVAGLLKQIGEGAARMSAIVKALKSYSYLDQAPQQEVDVTEGLEDTLLILRPKLRDVTVDKEYADDLGPILAYGSELNQVWTNLIDNAAYAVADSGDARITIRTYREDDSVVVEVEDNGPGIPPNIQARVFDSFFTTKPVGEGTGLGLDISYGIVVDRHRGLLEFASEPGKTCFRVALPASPS